MQNLSSEYEFYLLENKKSYIRINGFSLNLALKLRLGTNWKWPQIFIYFYYIDTSVLLENIPLVKFIKTTSGTLVVYFP